MDNQVQSQACGVDQIQLGVRAKYNFEGCLYAQLQQV